MINNTLAFIGPIGMPEMLVLAVLGLLIFGKRLPEVGKSLGKGIVSFKKGLQGVEDDIEQASNRPDDADEPAAKIEASNQDTVSASSTAEANATSESNSDSDKA